MPLLVVLDELPGDIIDLDNLESLNIKHNKFYGVIPPGICDINLNSQSLNAWFYYNNFCGPYPYPDCINIGTQQCD